MASPPHMHVVVVLVVATVVVIVVVGCNVDRDVTESAKIRFRRILCFKSVRCGSGFAVRSQLVTLSYVTTTC